MKVYEEISLKDFNFWGYAAVVANKMTEEDLEMVEQWMTEDGDEWDKTAINDLFAFEYEFIENLIGHNLVSEDESEDIDDEPEDIDNDCGYDAYEGCFTYDV